MDNSRLKLIRPPCSILKIKKKKYICNNEKLSSEAENQINKQGNNHELSPLLKKETRASAYEDKDPTHMFNSFLFTFLNIFQSSFPVEYKSMKEKK